MEDEMFASNNVCMATPEQHQRRGFGGRCGTVETTLEEFARRFGDPHESGSSDEKTTASWFFSTPRGLVAVYDYWWNRPGELSIGLRNGRRGDSRSMDARAALWAARFFRERGLRAWSVRRPD
jgi:hypothetical protein